MDWDAREMLPLEESIMLLLPSSMLNTANGTILSRYNVDKFSRFDNSYRLRVINLGCDPNYIFSIEGHTMTVISADAVEHQKLPVDSVQIFAGQRYSVIVRLSFI
jgi:FtsP/CotA-like multicopper oxidase with cupredoxin domain